MQLQLSFSTLLASVLVLLSSGAVEAAPTKRNVGIVTMPLKRLPQRSDVHPQVLFQQNLNRGAKRLARMTGREAPSDEELESRLVRRILTAGGVDVEARFNRHGTRFNRGGTTKTLSFRDLEGVPGLDSILKRTSAVTNYNDPGTVDGGDTSGNPDDTTGGGDTTGDPTGDPTGNGGDTTGDPTGDTTGDGGDTTGDPTGTTNGGATTGDPTTGTTDGGATTGDPTTGTTGSPDGTTSDGPPVGGDTGNGNGNGNGNGGNQGNSVSVANAPTFNNSLGLDIEGPDTGYLATIQIGTPPRKFSMLMDSGSADMWVGSEKCVSQGGGCGNHQFLGSASSSSFQDSKSPFQVTYGTGAVSGTIVKDNVNLAGLDLTGHVFGTADKETVDFSADSVAFDGLIGLAQSTLSNQKTLTPVEALAKQGLIQDAITSYKISRVADNKNDGEITFGGLDPSKFDQTTLQTVDNVSKNGFWEATMPSVEVDGKDSGLQGKSAILDTGTTLIIAPQADAEAIHKLIPGSQSDGQGGFTVPCDLKTSVALTFGGKSFAIDSRDLAFAPASQNGNDCISGIAGGDIDGPDVWLVGDVFLKNAYFSHDVTKNTISLATLV